VWPIPRTLTVEDRMDNLAVLHVELVTLHNAALAVERECQVRLQVKLFQADPQRIHPPQRPLWRTRYGSGPLHRQVGEPRDLLQDELDRPQQDLASHRVILPLLAFVRVKEVLLSGRLRWRSLSDTKRDGSPAEGRRPRRQTWSRSAPEASDAPRRPRCRGPFQCARGTGLRSRRPASTSGQ
jgi:hypothetical protein